MHKQETLQEYRQRQFRDWYTRNADAIRRDFWKRKGIEAQSVVA